MPLTLGLDSSTQSISAVIIDTDAGEVLFTESINFGERVSKYNAPSGYHTNEQGEFFADPMMWLDGLDLLLEKLKSKEAPLNKIEAIAGTAQQHATVYLNDTFEKTVSNLDSNRLLSAQIKPSLSREISPIWMDHTTNAQCKEITEAVGRDYLIQHSGSIATARFSGPQIRKFSQQDPSAYALTQHIHMCSSFMASVLSGSLAPLDHTDASGMNLLDIQSQTWDEKLLSATADDLLGKLPSLATSTTEIGTIAKYFTEKYGFSADTKIITWTGDNPASLVGMGASSPGRMVLSLGTSFTCFAAMDKPHTDPDGYGHVFCNPAGGYMSLTCFKNGALTCEHVRGLLGLTWEEFNDHVSAPPQPNRKIKKPFLFDEITPPTPANPNLKHSLAVSTKTLPEILSGMFINIRERTEWIGMSGDTIFLTGGASQSTGICQIIADVFEKNVQCLQNPGSASLGAAMLAAHTIGASTLDSLDIAFCAPSYKTYKPDKSAIEVYHSYTA